MRLVTRDRQFVRLAELPPARSKARKVAKTLRSREAPRPRCSRPRRTCEGRAVRSSAGYPLKNHAARTKTETTMRIIISKSTSPRSNRYQRLSSRTPLRFDPDALQRAEQ